jgi:hypothetical protein
MNEPQRACEQSPKALTPTVIGDAPPEQVGNIIGTGSGRVAYSGLSMARQSDAESRIHAILDFTRPLLRRLTWATTIVIAALVPLGAVAAALRPAIDPKSGPAPSSTVCSVAVVERGRQLASNNSTPPPIAAPHSAGSSDSFEKGMLTVTGRVLLPNGSPAANAVVSAIEGTWFGDVVVDRTVRTDAKGDFRLSHVYDTAWSLHAHTID